MPPSMPHCDRAEAQRSADRSCQNDPGPPHSAGAKPSVVSHRHAPPASNAARAPTPLGRRIARLGPKQPGRRDSTRLRSLRVAFPSPRATRYLTVCLASPRPGCHVACVLSRKAASVAMRRADAARPIVARLSRLLGSAICSGDPLVRKIGCVATAPYRVSHLPVSQRSASTLR